MMIDAWIHEKGTTEIQMAAKNNNTESFQL